jgi:hypothetical protein
MGRGGVMVHDIQGKRYTIEPGDGTHYEFSLLEVPPDVRGVGDLYPEYMTIVIHSPGTGCKEVMKYSLRDPSRNTVRYLSPNFSSDKYTVAVVYLACCVLADDPENTELAAYAMLSAGDYL